MGLVGTIQGIDSEDEPLDEGGWLVFLEGHSIQDSRGYSLHIAGRRGHWQELLSIFAAPNGQW